MDVLVDLLRTSFKRGLTKTLEWRRTQLMALERLIDENQKELCDAIKQDLNKHAQEVVTSEFGLIRNAITHSLQHLNEYVVPQQVKPQMLMRLTYSTFIQYQPYGVVLVIGAWNYPYQLCLVPLVGAIAAGNCVLVKPSELSEKTAQLMAKLIPKYLDADCVQVFNGGVSETINLLKEKFDYIFYTGSTQIGKSIMQAAAVHMTPVTLECGGKSPVYIDTSADLQVAAKRLVWGRFSNAGQTCIAPDYVLCTKQTQEAILPLMKKAIEEFYTSEPQKSDSYGRIVNKRHFNRLLNLLDLTKIAFGGHTDEATHYISPTLMINCTRDDKCMQEEIFGPVLPFVSVQNYQEAIDFINDGEKPLALYIFANDNQLYEEFLLNTTSGSYACNDVLVQCALECLPFGGVGASGVGAYHGRFSFETFSHKRAVLKGTSFGDSLMTFRYPPYSDAKLKQSQMATGLFKNGFLSKLLN